eukprot:scaffold2.g6836.t1
MAGSRSAAVQQRLSAEVLRKLRLAAEAERKEDRDIICSEVFADITGELNTAARERAGLGYARWYEALAPYFAGNWDESEALLAACRRLWGQPFTAPTYALLLHQWLLLHADAGGRDQRQKHLAVLVSGARQLFIGDVETASSAFQPLFTFIADQVVLNPDRTRLSALPSPGRESTMTLAAAFLPYYGTSKQNLEALSHFPSPRAVAARGGGGGISEVAPLAGTPAPDWEGADFMLDRIADVLAKEIRAEANRMCTRVQAGLLRYLATLMALREAPALGLVRKATRLRLQHVLYTLTQPGGPRRAPRTVNRLASAVLDALFPSGRRIRALISLAFRFLHPHEWLWLPFWHAALASARRLLALLVAAFAALRGGLLKLRAAAARR